jgi:geranylgeranyl reductase family protein
LLSYDVLVVGGGPAGLYAGWKFAEAGFGVAVCEEHAAIGAPAHCTGVISAELFDEFALPRDTILNELDAVRFVSPTGLEVPFASPSIRALVIDRVRFDQRLAQRAAAAGADVRVHARVSDLQVDADGVRARAGGMPITARLAVLACGASYMVQRQLGLGLPRSHLLTAQRELPARRLGAVELHFGTDVAPAGFAWAVPVRRGGEPFVRVGVMAARQPVEWYGAMVNRLAPRWGLEAPSPGDPPRLKYLPLRSIARTYADRLLVVGDAAGLVKPTTGGGIYYSVLSAAMAAEVGEAALRADRFDAARLREYEVRWRRRLGGEFRAQSLLRHIAQRMSDRQIDALFELALTDGVMPIVHRTASFNRHRHLIQALLRHAPARRILWPARSRG